METFLQSYFFNSFLYNNSFKMNSIYNYLSSYFRLFFLFFYNQCEFSKMIFMEVKSIYDETYFGPLGPMNDEISQLLFLSFILHIFIYGIMISIISFILLFVGITYSRTMSRKYCRTHTQFYPWFEIGFTIIFHFGIFHCLLFNFCSYLPIGFMISELSHRFSVQHQKQLLTKHE